jgi:hypothetical protein
MEGRIKENKGLYESTSVHCKKYDGHCTKQQIKIPKAI